MGDDDFDGRDERGRWKKGFCPNRRGRPRKKPEISDADVHHFKNTSVTAKINGEERLLTRQELLLHSMYEQAIKGKSTVIARKLFERFEKADETYAEARLLFKALSKRLLEQYYTSGEFDAELEADVRELAEMLQIDLDRPRRRRCRVQLPRTATWRKNPKPQSLLDLERAEEETAEAAAKAEWMRRHGVQATEEPEEEKK